MEPPVSRMLAAQADAALTRAPGLVADLRAEDAASDRRASLATTQVEPDRVADIVRRARADPRAFGELYDAYFARIYGYVAARLPRADAEDVVADTFLRALDKLQQFDYRGPGSFAAWLFRIARNRVLDEHARQARLTTVDLPSDTHELALPDGVPSGDVEREEEARLLRDLINSLSPRRQEVIALKFFGGLRNREIAEVICLDQRTVASHLCRALEELRDRYERAVNALQEGRDV